MCSLVHPCLNGPSSEDSPLPCPGGEPVSCKKCKESRAVVNLRLRDAYCAQCFLSAFTHKFRAGLGKRKVLRPGERAAVCFDGGAGAIALLRLLAEGAEEEGRDGGRRRKILFDPIVLVMDGIAPFVKEREKRMSIVQEIIRKAQKFAFPVFFVALENSLDPSAKVHGPLGNWTPADQLLPTEESANKLRKMFEVISDMTAKESLIRHMRKKALVQASTQLGASKLFTAESSTDLAITLMTDLGTGRGSDLASETGYRDDSPYGAEVSILRVMREFSSKEIAFYNALMKQDGPAVPPTFSQGKDSLSSVARLTEEFVVGLQEGFPATVPTILRTGAKLEVPVASRPCPLCGGCGGGDGGGEEVGETSSSAVEAAKFSALVSLRGPAGLPEAHLRTEALEELCVEYEVNAQKKSGAGCNGMIDTGVCHSCSVILTSMDEVPSTLLNRGNLSRQDMVKDKIKDFLL